MVDDPKGNEEELTGQTVEGAEASQEGDVETRARRMGWRPKEEYRGDPDAWITAEEFIAKGETELPILRERNRTLDRHLQQSERRLAKMEADLSSAREVLTEFREFSRKGEDRAYTRAKMELEEKHRKQVSEADVPGAEATAKELIDLEAEKAKPKATPVATPAAPTVSPEVLQFVDDNKEWWHGDSAMRGAAIAIHGDLLTQRPDLSIGDNLKEVKRQIVQRFPDKFSDPRRNQPAASVNGSRSPDNRPKGKTYNDLPPEAKRACDKTMKEMNATNPKVPYTREEYLKIYFAGESA